LILDARLVATATGRFAFHTLRPTMNTSTFRSMKLLGAILFATMLTACPNQALNDSKQALNAGNKANGAKQFEQAINEYQKAVDRYHDNHLAWYGMGAAEAGKGDWTKASDAFSTAVQLDDKEPMYQMWYGIALYEKAVATARDDQAKKEGKKPEEIKPDLSAVNFEKAEQHLQEAIKLNGDMWRAHFYLGRIYRGQDKPKDAANEFTAAIKANPRESGPYIALGELYRKWDYTDEAIKIAMQGTQNVPGSNEVSDIWYVLGMKFQRGQAYFRKGDFVHAKRDLEDFSKSGGASLEFAKQQASKMLMDIAAKSAGDNAAPSQKQSPEDLVKKAKGGKGK
jgi:tetratricopeptide (TPR) repeat protein